MNYRRCSHPSMVGCRSAHLFSACIFRWERLERWTVLAYGDVGESGVSLGTVINFESGERQAIRAVMEAIRKALEDAGVEFIPENGGGLGVRFANRRKSS